MIKINKGIIKSGEKGGPRLFVPRLDSVLGREGNGAVIVEVVES